MSDITEQAMAHKVLTEVGEDRSRRAAQVWSEWRLLPGTAPLTAVEAQARQNKLRAEGLCLNWLVGVATALEGAVMARAHTSNPHGGVLLPSGLVAPTLAELRQMMPTGLVREDRQAWDRIEIIEVWWA